MKRLPVKFLLLAAVCCGLVLSGAEDKNKEAEAELAQKLTAASGTLKIADTIGNEEIVRNAALFWGSSNANMDITITKTTLLEVTEEKDDAKYDLVIYQTNPHNDYNLIPFGRSVVYALEPAVIYVRKDNKLTNIATSALNEIFCGDISTWQSLTNSNYTIRRYGVVFPEAGERAFRLTVMGQLGYTDNLLQLPSINDVLVNVSGSANAIGFGGYTDYRKVENIKTVPVDGVAPDIGNIRNGSYPLSLQRQGAIRNENANAVLFMQLLASVEARLKMSQKGLLPPQ